MTSRFDLDLFVFDRRGGYRGSVVRDGLTLAGVASIALNGAVNDGSVCNPLRGARYTVAKRGCSNPRSDRGCSRGYNRVIQHE